MSREATRDKLGLGESLGYKLWITVMRIVAPMGIFLVAAGTVLSY